MRDEDDDKPIPDPDRAAILARRKHFIALALSGLATTACTNKDEGDGKAKQDEQSETKPEVPPQPCLSVEPLPPEGPSAEDPPPEIPPHACLKIAKPETEETGETGAAIAEPSPETETETQTEPKPKPEPQPCLRSRPRPCLKKPAPKPCLDVL